MSTQIAINDNLVDLNKKMIASMMPNLNKYKQVIVNTPSSASAPIQPQTNRPFITAEEISQEKQTMFNRALQSKQEEFNNYNKKPVPENVDFSDGAQDKPIGAEMDKMLQDAINWRQKQLNMVYDNQDQTNALNWINKDQDPKQIQQAQIQQVQTQNIQQSMQNNKSKILKIGQDTSLDNNVVINIKENNQNQVSKKVNFSDKIENINEINNNNNDFLSLLKRRSDHNSNESNIIQLNENNNMNINNSNAQDELIKMLKEILANQCKILDLLTNKNV
jgi:hypothetical protein